MAKIQFSFISSDGNEKGLCCPTQFVTYVNRFEVSMEVIYLPRFRSKLWMDDNLAKKQNVIQTLSLSQGTSDLIIYMW